jgi:hypothetical protein
MPGIDKDEKGNKNKLQRINELMIIEGFLFFAFVRPGRRFVIMFHFLNLIIKRFYQKQKAYSR